MLRYDFRNIDSKDYEKTPQGFLKVRAYTARTGVQVYKKAGGGTIREYRPDGEVFSEKNLKALETSPVTNGHPPELLSPDNCKKFIVGFPIGRPKRVDSDGPENYLQTYLTITDADAIRAIKSGKAQISNGYNVKLDMTPGEHRGQKYDAIQKDIVNNHIAIVWKARGGEKCSIKMDEEDASLILPGGDDILDLDSTGAAVFDLDDALAG